MKFHSSRTKILSAVEMQGYSNWKSSAVINFSRKHAPYRHINNYSYIKTMSCDILQLISDNEQKITRNVQRQRSNVSL